MSNSSIQESASVIDQIAVSHAFGPKSDSSPLFIRWRHRVRMWIARHRQRQALGELAERNDYLLQDIGVSQGDALREATKPFWQR